MLSKEEILHPVGVFCLITERPYGQNLKFPCLNTEPQLPPAGPALQSSRVLGIHDHRSQYCKIMSKRSPTHHCFSFSGEFEHGWSLQNCLQCYNAAKSSKSIHRNWLNHSIDIQRNQAQKRKELSSSSKG